MCEGGIGGVSNSSRPATESIGEERGGVRVTTKRKKMKFRRENTER